MARCRGARRGGAAAGAVARRRASRASSPGRGRPRERRPAHERSARGRRRRLIPAESFHRNVSAEKMASLRQKAVQQLIDDELAYQDGVRRGHHGARRRRRGADDAGGQAVRRYAEVRRGARAGRARRSPTRGAEIRRALTIAKTREVAVTAKCQVGDEEALRFFTANPERFVEPEQLHIYAITVGVDPSSTAEQWAAAKLGPRRRGENYRAGASFEATALKYSTDPSRRQGRRHGVRPPRQPDRRLRAGRRRACRSDSRAT